MLDRWIPMLTPDIGDKGVRSQEWDIGRLGTSPILAQREGGFVLCVL